MGRKLFHMIIPTLKMSHFYYKIIDFYKAYSKCSKISDFIFKISFESLNSIPIESKFGLIFSSS